VREVEKLAKAGRRTVRRRKGPAEREKDADTRALEADLSAALGMPVTSAMTMKAGGGKIIDKYKRFRRPRRPDPQAEREAETVHASSSRKTHSAPDDLWTSSRSVVPSSLDQA
jgi:hypothetical protein